MATETSNTPRDERAERRAASIDRAAAAKQQVTTRIVDTDDRGTVTLSTEEIRTATGNTPLGAGVSAGIGHLDDGGSGRGARTGGDGRAVGDAREVAGTGVTPATATGAQAIGGPSNDGTRGPGTTAARPDTTASRNDDGHGGMGPARTPPPRQLAPEAMRAVGTPAVAPPAPIVIREKAKSLKLTKFKGLDDAMPVTMWLKTVREEVRRQAVTRGVNWQEKQLYHEVAAHLEGEAQRWFATVMETVPESEENIGTLADMLRAKYVTRRTGPEVVDLLNSRRQMRGERLLEFAQSLREIAEQGDIGEDWLVNAFPKGMSSTIGATNVRGHRPRNQDDAVNLAIPHVGDYGEGYGVGLEKAMTTWDEREATKGRWPLATAAATQDQEQTSWSGNNGSVVTGYGPMWGKAHKPPSYDTEGRPVMDGKASVGEWWKAIPPGYKLVPANQGPPTNSSKIQTGGGGQPTAAPQQSGWRGKRPAGGEQSARRPAKVLKVEGQGGGGHYGGGGRVTDAPFDTREGRLRRNEQYLQRRTATGGFGARSNDQCYWCGQAGHYSRDCDVRREDLAAHATAAAQDSTEMADGQGNEQRA
ncbi:hypothetical protein PF005_g27164 [Phytophthora fragariae]|uniref:CCHC-type domain-containing protein n=1 Tax=Phytophthora fragariae TaxID=53985 RepID=A0A6A3DPX6_9STRA|nr:hypothetical protein PF003_g5880 [Phytophthora fragariae]KAE8921827.1 hypothetical protein PF009_g27900 [Phytophthora fragariae]KAE9075290.1 hypothetical protein PF007_g25070 [Phytophthora fragariae]KAE9088549.1 hypothetical protein PF006_g25556 [Phytophthora fragariae]KAE9171385.1 hypothetical protein PF005_g27164 [Phytophthora fragariae]